MEDKISMMPTTALHTATPFKTLFPIKETVLNEIADDMKKNGFDYAHPIIIWAGHKVTVVDGHTRLAAAQKIHLNKVPVTLKEFADEEEALRYAIKSQSHRRNLTAEELLNCLTELDKRRKVGRPEKIATNVAISGRSSQKTADLLGISRGKVEKLRTIKDHAPCSIRNAVAAGTMSIDKGYKETVKQKTQGLTENKTFSNDELKVIKRERLNSIQTKILKFITSKLEEEVQNNPELSYSENEKKQFAEVVATEVRNLIATTLPRETENE